MILGGSSLFQPPCTLAQSSMSEHSSPAKTPGLARLVSKPGSLNPQARRRRRVPAKEETPMSIPKIALVLVWLMSVPTGPLHTQEAPKEAKVTPLFSKDLADFPGKEGLMITVEYPPGSTDPIHRHNAHGFIYVLEGSIVMQVRGGKEVTLTPGQTFYEGPNDVHVVGRNASQTKPAKFVVFFVKDKGAPIVVPGK